MFISRRQHLIQFIQQRPQALAKKLIGFSDAAFFFKGGIFKIFLSIYAQASNNMFLDFLQPEQLFFAELLP